MPFRTVRFHPSLEEGLTRNWQVNWTLSNFIHVVSTAVGLLHGDIHRTDEAVSAAAVQLCEGTDSADVTENIQTCLDIHCVLLPVHVELGR